MKHQPEQENGQAIVILALVMVVLLAFAALAIDGGNAYVERRRAQNAADAAALAGARELWLHLAAVPYPISEDRSIRSAINQAAEENGIADSNGVPGDFYNTNILPYYTDKAGNQLSTVEVGADNNIPANAGGVQVKAGRNFGTFIAGIIGRSDMAADAQATAVIIKPPTCGDYAIYAGGPGGNPTALKVTGSNGGGPNAQVVDGGFYSGGDAQFQNVDVTGNPLPPIDVAGECQGGCSLAYDGAPSYGATPQEFPELYQLADYQPGGQYAVATGWTASCTPPNGCGNYHYYNSNFSASNTNLTGLYYVNGDVDLHDVTGNASFVATGAIQLNGVISLNTFDPRFPLFFTTSSDTSQGAIKSSNPTLDLHGFIYAPNGLVKISGADGQLYGAIYSKFAEWDASEANIYYEPAFCPPTQARVILLK